MNGKADLLLDRTNESFIVLNFSIYKANTMKVTQYLSTKLPKLLVLCIVLLLINASKTSAQIADIELSKKEFKVGYGILSIPELAISIGNSLGVAIGSSLGLAVGDIVSTLVNGQPTNVKITKIEGDLIWYGTFQVGYNRFVKKRLSLGLQASYTPMLFKDVVYYSDGSTRTYSSKSAFAQLYGRLDFHYIQKPRFQMYSGLLVGGLSDFTNLTWAAHLNFLGFRFGKSHAFYTELGFGFSSMITMGYSKRF
jgi:hypothetical protein